MQAILSSSHLLHQNFDIAKIWRIFPKKNLAKLVKFTLQNLNFAISSVEKITKNFPKKFFFTGIYKHENYLF
jgi:hypothetical protein